jgi:hypothetical protein
MPGDLASDTAMRPVLPMEPAVDVMRDAELIRLVLGWATGVVDNRRSKLFRAVNPTVSDYFDAGPPGLEPV